MLRYSSWITVHTTLLFASYFIFKRWQNICCFGVNAQWEVKKTTLKICETIKQTKRQVGQSWVKQSPTSSDLLQKQFPWHAGGGGYLSLLCSLSPKTNPSQTINSACERDRFQVHLHHHHHFHILHHQVSLLLLLVIRFMSSLSGWTGLLPLQARG